MLRPFHACSNIQDLIEAEQSIYQNVQYFIWSKKSVFHLLQLDILCTSAVNNVIKTTIHRTRATLFCAIEFIWKPEKLATE